MGQINFDRDIRQRRRDKEEDKQIDNFLLQKHHRSGRVELDKNTKQACKAHDRKQYPIGVRCRPVSFPDYKILEESLQNIAGANKRSYNVSPSFTHYSVASHGSIVCKICIGKECASKNLFDPRNALAIADLILASIDKCSPKRFIVI